LTDNGISTQETAYGITALGVSITGKTELFRVLERSKTPCPYGQAGVRSGGNSKEPEMGGCVNKRAVRDFPIPNPIF